MFPNKALGPKPKNAIRITLPPVDELLEELPDESVELLLDELVEEKLLSGVNERLLLEIGNGSDDELVELPGEGDCSDGKLGRLNELELLELDELEEVLGCGPELDDDEEELLKILPFYYD